MKWTDGTYVLDVAEGIPTHHLLALGWAPVKDPTPAPQPTTELPADIPRPRTPSRRGKP